MHGGRREGAGRPSIGVTRKVSITIPEEYWQAIEDDRGDMKLSAYLRELIIRKMDEIL
ncbi:MAG: CopG family transcriptional regulator [Parageobacillus thermoglucosidasius]|nr:MAG: CopG family transcriptional regulator [Parageobacillus thermoglucosidasius]